MEKVGGICAVQDACVRCNMIAALCQKVNQRCSLVTWDGGKKEAEGRRRWLLEDDSRRGQEGGRRQEETEW